MAAEAMKVMFVLNIVVFLLVLITLVPLVYIFNRSLAACFDDACRNTVTSTRAKVVLAMCAIALFTLIGTVLFLVLWLTRRDEERRAR